MFGKILSRLLTALLFLFAIPACAADVLLGPGDVIRISVYGSPDLATEVRVSEDGNVTFPLLGAVRVGGMTSSSAEKAIASQLEINRILKKPQVSVLVTSLNSRQVSVLGHVNRPGRYPIEGRRKILEMLATAGGISADGADMVNLVRSRSGQTRRESIDVIEMVRSGELDRDYEVIAGDLIFVERAPRFYITGEVQNPGAFRIERGMTVLQAVSAGGGLTQRGTMRRMSVTRRGLDGATSTVAANQGDLLRPDDVITVQESWF